MNRAQQRRREHDSWQPAARQAHGHERINYLVAGTEYSLGGLPGDDCAGWARQPAPPPCRSPPWALCEISFSFSTVNCGFSLKPKIIAVRLVGNCTHHRVVLLHRLDVAVARHRDAVFGALELRLQVAEVLIGLELRIVFHDHHQARQRRGQLALRRLKLRERLRVVDEFRRGLDRAHLGARVGDAEQHLPAPGRQSPSRSRPDWESDRSAAGTGSRPRPRPP